jgi:general secretion pathway protein H
MPAGRWRYIKGGFTLIEMVVTMVVMAVIIGIAMANIGSGSRSILGREAKKLAYFMELVHDEAVTRGEGMGVSFSANTPVLWRESGQDWIQMPADDIVGDGTVGNGVKIAGAWVDGLPVSGADKVEFQPSGSIAPYSLKLALDGMETDLNGDLFGRVSITEKPKLANSP